MATKNIKITTLTPLHTGSGKEFQGNFEYLYFQDDEEIALIDESKVLKVIGRENIDHWLSIIDQGQDLLRYLEKRKPGIEPRDVAKRRLVMHGKPPRPQQPIREQAHTGYKALLAGSSIKGAIRTALLNLFMHWDVEDYDRYPQQLKDRNGRFSDRNIIKQYFGKDPNSDLLRLLQVGDAFFGETACYLAKSLNKGRDDWEFKDGRNRQANISQYIEAVPPGCSTTFRLKFNDKLQAVNKSPYRNNNKAKSIINPKKMMLYIRQHSTALLNNELDFWHEENSYAQAADDYLDQVEAILTQIKACAENECILRIGWGTGFKNMTGDWQEELMASNDYRNLKRELRRRKNYPDWMPLPKTRRMLEDGTPLGFVKLTIL